MQGQDYTQVKWAHASSKHVVNAVSHHQLVIQPHKVIVHETHEDGEGEADELQLMVHDRHIKLHTQKEPLRDSDFVVLTVCCYRQKIKK